MQIASFLAAEFPKLGAEIHQRIGEAGRFRPRPWAAQHRAFQRCDRVRMRVGGGAQAERGMFQQGQQRHRLKPAECRFCCQPREPPGGSIAEQVAAGIVDRHVPAR